MFILSLNPITDAPGTIRVHSCSSVAPVFQALSFKRHTTPQRNAPQSFCLYITLGTCVGPPGLMSHWNIGHPTGGSRHRQGLCRPSGPGGRWVRRGLFWQRFSTKNQEPRTKNQEPKPKTKTKPPNLSAQNFSACPLLGGYLGATSRGAAGLHLALRPTPYALRSTLYALRIGRYLGATSRGAAGLHLALRPTLYALRSSPYAAWRTLSWTHFANRWAGTNESAVAEDRSPSKGRSSRSHAAHRGTQNRCPGPTLVGSDERRPTPSTARDAGW